MTPFDKHSDDGFGAMADAFKTSAETILASEKDPMDQREVPVCFLLRHAAELFLKSSLVILHRAFKGNIKGYPSIQVNGKSKPLTNVHGLGPLYSALVGLMTEHSVELARRSRTVWLPMPQDLANAIAVIDKMDSRGVFFRYPTESNSRKSNSKPITREEMATWDRERQGHLKAFLVIDESDEMVEAFRYQSNILTQELEILKTACEQLDCLHVGLRMELAGGW